MKTPTMSEKASTILIYGICETPSILWNEFIRKPCESGINRQYICLDKQLSTIRLGSKGWLEMKPEQLLQFQSNKDMILFAKEMLLSKVNAFSKPIKNAIVAYFEWVEQECKKISKSEISKTIDPLFVNPEQLFFSSFLPLPHPKIVVSDSKKNLIGVANFDLSFCIDKKVYLLTFSKGEFIRKSERELREKLLISSDRFVFADLPKPKQNKILDKDYINQLLQTIPNLKSFVENKKLPHGIYYPDKLKI